MVKTQTRSFPMRLPDRMQVEALRLLEASTAAINQIIIELWPQLDLFAGERTGLAWKQVDKQLVSRSGHGSRQERCEMEYERRNRELAHLAANLLIGLSFTRVICLGSEHERREPRGTTHTCQRCGKQARTYLSPAASDRKQAMDWAPWLCCPPRWFLHTLAECPKETTAMCWMIADSKLHSV